MQAGYYDATVATTTLNSVELKQARRDQACTVGLNSMRDQTRHSKNVHWMGQF